MGGWKPQGWERGERLVQGQKLKHPEEHGATNEDV